MKAARTRALNRKHAGTGKHHATAKHTGSATRRSATAHKQKAMRTAAAVKAAHLRAWAPGSDLALCTAAAFGETLRIATGRAVSHAELSGVYWLTAAHADAGASILATADVILASGLSGSFPLSVDPAPEAWRQILGQRCEACGSPDCSCPCSACDDSAARFDAPGAIVHGLILGLDMPEGRHTVAVDPSGYVWSWGELYELTSEAVVEEAWAVTWR